MATDLKLIIDEFEAAGVLEDRMEYAIYDLMVGCDLSNNDATALQRLLHADDPTFQSF